MRDLYYYHELEDLYEDMLNDCYDSVNICGTEYDPGSALRRIDEISFRCGVSDWESEYFEEVGYSVMTSEERQRHCVTSGQVMYAKKNDI